MSARDSDRFTTNRPALDSDQAPDATGGQDASTSEAAGNALEQSVARSPDCELSGSRATTDDMKFIIIGGSSGSLDPIIDILARLPADLNAAVLIVRHTSPQAPPRLARVLQADSVLPVLNADHGSMIRRGRIYVAIPGHSTEVRQHPDGSLRFSSEPIEANRKPTPNVNCSLISGAELFGDNCIAVILSGYLDDGTRGAQELARHHGTTIAQLPEEAEAESMPLNVIHRDSPEFVLRGRHISHVLAQLAGCRLPADLARLADLP